MRGISDSSRWEERDTGTDTDRHVVVWLLAHTLPARRLGVLAHQHACNMHPARAADLRLLFRLRPHAPKHAWLQQRRLANANANTCNTVCTTTSCSRLQTVTAAATMQSTRVQVVARLPPTTAASAGTHMGPTEIAGKHQTSSDGRCLLFVIGGALPWCHGSPGRAAGAGGRRGGGGWSG